uniref:JmjC domain-containing protein n=1 Tax=Bionectria ochroleuca TaxID=29856 RepID=A0A8H7N7J1_BIOOC
MAQESQVLFTAEEPQAEVGRIYSPQMMDYRLEHEMPQNSGTQQSSMNLTSEQQELPDPGNPDLRTLSKYDPEHLPSWHFQGTKPPRIPHPPSPSAPSPVAALPSPRIVEQPHILQGLPASNIQIPSKAQFLGILIPRGLDSDGLTGAAISQGRPINASLPSPEIVEKLQNPPPILETAVHFDFRDSSNPVAQSIEPNEQTSASIFPFTEPALIPPMAEQVVSQGLRQIDLEGVEVFSASDSSGIIHNQEQKDLEEDASFSDRQEAEATQSEETLPSLDRGESPSTDSLSTLNSDRFDESVVTFQEAEEEEKVEFERDSGSDDILRLKPTLRQWEDFPSLLSFARAHNAELDGCFKIVLPDGALEAIPEKPAQLVDANAFTPQLLRPSRIWRVNTKPTTGKFPSSSDIKESSFTGNATEAAKRLSKIFSKSRNRQIRDVRYRVDVPAWSAEQRLAAGVPGKSPLHPLKGDKLDLTKAIIPGIHTPYVYESGPAFGATFQLHAEDFRLSSLNHLYKGRKIWIIIPSAAVGLAEEQLGRNERCSQFMRHRAEFVFPEKLERLGIPFRLIDQSPGETIVILPDAYHEGFSTGYTLAEAKNYAEETWSTETYQPCDATCQLATAIPGDFMRIIEDGEDRLDLCSSYDDDSPDSMKQEPDEEDSAPEEPTEQREEPTEQREEPTEQQEEPTEQQEEPTEQQEQRPRKRIKWIKGGMSSNASNLDL